MASPKVKPKALPADDGVLVEPVAYNVEPLWAATVGVTMMAAREFAKQGVVSLRTLSAMGKTFIPAAITRVRTNDVAEYAEMSLDKFQPGWTIQMRDPNATPTRHDLKAMRRLSEVFLRAGDVFWPNGFEGLLRAIVPQSLIWDRYCFEVLRESDGTPWALVPVDASTIAKAIPTAQQGKGGQWYPRGNQTAYLQIADNDIVAEFTRYQLAWGVRNPSARINAFGYGVPELELAIPLITDALNISVANSSIASAGLRSEAIILYHTDADDRRWRAIERNVSAALASSTRNRHRVPIVKVDPSIKEDVTVVPLHRGASDMQMAQQLAQVTKYICAIYDIDPARINMLYGNEFQTNTISGAGSSARIAQGRRQVLPLLKNLAHTFNSTVVWPTHPKYRFVFTGTDTQSEAERVEAYTKAAQVYLSPNEVRTMLGLSPFTDTVSKHPLHAQYTTLIQQELDAESEAKAQTERDMQIDEGGFPAWLGGKRLTDRPR